MGLDHTGAERRHRLWAAAAGLAVVVAVVAGVEVASTARTPLEEGPPLLGWTYWVRSAGIAVVGAGTIIMARTVALRRLEARPATGRPAEDRIRERLAAGVGVAVTIGATLLLGLSPTVLTALAQEDGLVEWGSAALLAVAAATTGRAGVRWYRATGRLTGLACLAGAAVFLLLGLEEVSFFQRQIEFSSPDVFVAGRGQPELNLHNFATNLSEQGYYFGAFVLCVGLPTVLGDRRLRSPGLRWLEPLIPPPTVLYGVVTAAGLTYEMWNTLPVQLAFWASLAALLLRSLEQGCGLDMVLAVVMVAALAVVLSSGDTMIRSWDETEIRELLIPYGLVLYGRALMQAARSRTA